MNTQAQLSNLREMIKFSIPLFKNVDNPSETFAEIRLQPELKEESPTKVLPLESRAFSQYLKSKGQGDLQSVASNYSDSCIRQVIQEAAAYAQFRSSARRIGVRVAEHEGKHYIDLANEAGEIVEIAEGRWKLIKKAPVEFVRINGVQPLPRPDRKGSIDHLWKYANVRPEDRILLVSVLLMCLNPHGPYPLLFLNAEQGSGKSMLMWLIQQLVDPNFHGIRSAPTAERDLLQVASECWLLAFDNLSRIPQSLSDGLCRISTGTSDFGLPIYSSTPLVRRPVVFNSIEDLSLQSDLLDRTVWLTLPSIPASKRRPDHELRTEFLEDAPKIFGAMLNALAKATESVKSVEIAELPRMADFARWSVAAETHAGFGEGAFLSAYNNNRSLSDVLVVESSAVGSAVRKLLLIDETWSGTAQELLDELLQQFPDDMSRSGRAPETPRKLSSLLRRVAPHLRRTGFEVEVDIKTATQRLIHLNLSRERTEEEWDELDDWHRDLANQTGKGKAGVELASKLQEILATRPKSTPIDGMDGVDDSTEIEI